MLVITFAHIIYVYFNMPNSLIVVKWDTSNQSVELQFVLPSVMINRVVQILISCVSNDCLSLSTILKVNVNIQKHLHIPLSSFHDYIVDTGIQVSYISPELSKTLLPLHNSEAKLQPK